MVCLYISGSKAGFLYVINCFDCLSWCALRLLLLVCQDWLFAEKTPNEALQIFATEIRWTLEP